MDEARRSLPKYCSCWIFGLYHCFGSCQIYDFWNHSCPCMITLILVAIKVKKLKIQMMKKVMMRKRMKEEIVKKMKKMKKLINQNPMIPQVKDLPWQAKILRWCIKMIPMLERILYWITHPTRYLGALSKRGIEKLDILFLLGRL